MAYQKNRATGLSPVQNTETNQSTSAVSHSRTIRFDDVSVVTSGFGGKFLPIAMIPLLREDRALNSTVNLSFQMSETADMLLNPVRASASAWLVPKMALERFQHGGFGAINRSFNGEPEIDDTVIPWFEEWDPDETGGNTDSKEIVSQLGLHYSNGQTMNSDYVESYNAVWNYIAKQMSKDIPLRDRLNSDIAPAFWEHTQMRHVKATFDDAMLEGQVPIEFIGDSGQLEIPGIRRYGAAVQTGPANISDTAADISLNDGQGNGLTFDLDREDLTQRLYAVMEEDNFRMTLANIDLARETAAWARMRTRYQGLDEEWMMDQLLAGIRIPEEGMKQPVLLDRQTVPFGMTQRYATDGASLQQSATNGQTGMTLRIRTPPVNTGGVIVVCAQMLPEMIYERQRDYYFAAKTVDALPNRTADELDPQPVVEVYNQEVDELHSLPSDVFGYAPLNHQWAVRNKPKIGGKYYRDDPTGPWDEDRNRIWDTTTVDPKLGEDFYLSSNIRHDVFMTTTSDPFEIWCQGRVPIEGLTFFGPQLRESTGDYDAVLSQVKTDRITPPTITAQDEIPADD